MRGGTRTDDRDPADPRRLTRADSERRAHADVVGCRPDYRPIGAPPVPRLEDLDPQLTIVDPKIAILDDKGLIRPVANGDTQLTAVVAGQNRRISFGALGGNDDRMGKTFRTAAVCAQYLVGLLSAGPFHGNFL